MSKSINSYWDPGDFTLAHCEISTTPTQFITGSTTEVTVFKKSLTGVTGTVSGTLTPNAVFLQGLTGYLFSSKLSGQLYQRINKPLAGATGNISNGAGPSTIHTPATTSYAQPVSGALSSLTGVLDITVPLFGVSGELSPVGEVIKKVMIPLSGSPASLSGELESLATGRVTVGGQISPLGKITKLITHEVIGATGVSSGVLTPELFELEGATGSLTGELTFKFLPALAGATGPLTGVLTPIALTELQALSGQISNWTKNLTVNHIKDVSWYPPLTGQANVDSLVIEADAAFERTYRWEDSTGHPYPIDNFTWSMVIKPTADSCIIIASTAEDTITITDDVTAGEFTVTISEAVSADLNFTRAIYSIEATFALGTIRLLEGEVRLSRDTQPIPVQYDVSIGGPLAPVGAVTTRRAVSLSGVTGALSGVLTPIEPEKFFGVISPIGVLTPLKNEVPTQALSGATGTVSGVVARAIAISLEGNLEMSNGGIGA